MEVLNKTKTDQRRLLIPGTETYIYQSNKVTNGRYGFSNLQLRIFVCLIKSLQVAILREMKGENTSQLVLFKESENIIQVPIRLGDISIPENYKSVVEAANSLTKIQVQLPVSKYGKDYLDVAAVITRVSAPKRSNTGTYLYLDMYKDVAQLFIHIEKNAQGNPISFTRYQFEIAVSSKSKYTALLYIKISSWKAKGGFFITLDDLRKDLGLTPNEYVNFNDFKRFVLMPAQKELKERKECWFNCSERDFVVKDGKKVIGLNFKIITEERQAANRRQADDIRQLLRMHFSFKDDDLKQLEPLFAASFDYQKISVKLTELSEHLKVNKATIGNPKAYVIKSLFNEVAPQE